MGPFAETTSEGMTDAELVTGAVAGDSLSLENLVLKHQAWIYNVALRMVGDPHDAEDVTQEILSKMVTHLSTFEGRSKFRTWLYRIVTNHVLNMKKRPREFNRTFSVYGEAIDRSPDIDLPDSKALPVDADLLVEETKHLCLAGMLLCLSRDQRLVFILGGIFCLSDAIGSEILEISKPAYRKRLSRARGRLRHFMEERCSLVREGNSCSCSKKTAGLISLGEIKPTKLRFARGDARTIKEIAPRKLISFRSFWDTRCTPLFRDQPFYEPSDFVEALRGITEKTDFKDLFELN
ncbi:MAG: RNA polymerase sigma factor [bacterium]|nr:RNA polymerase sigma factor [bacterium]